MTPIKRRLTYFFRTNSRLRLRISWSGRSYDMSVGYKVDREDAKGKPKWDGSRCKTATTHGPDKIAASIINKALENLEEKIDKTFYSFEITDTIPSVDDLKERLCSDEKRNTCPEIETAFNQFIVEKERYNQWAYNTVRTVRNIGNLIKKFQPKLTFKDIDEELLRNFVLWQQTNRLSEDEYKVKQVGYSNPVILKNCRIVKWFLEWSEQKGYIRKGLAASFRPALKKVDNEVVFLTWEELLKVETLPIQDPVRDRARDFFCFCCFSSLRYSDAFALKKTSVYDEYIEVVSKKTDKSLKIDLNTHSRRILDKYRDLPGEFALPRVDISWGNKLLKEIGKIAGIDSPVSIVQYYGGKRIENTYKKWELLSTHSGRRTFICNALAMGIPAHIVMKWTGHSDFASMKPHIGVADQVRINAMKNFDTIDSAPESSGDKNGDKNTQS